MPLTAQELLDLRTSLVVRWNRGLAAQNEDWKRIAGFIKSTGDSNTYEWMSQFPAFRKWVGQRLHKTARETAYRVRNEKYEATLDIPAEDIEDRRWFHYGDVAESHGVAVGDHKNDLVFSQLKNGFTELCYDGQPFFDADHPVYPNEDGTGAAVTVSNLQAGTGEPWILACTRRAPKFLYLQERTPARFDQMIDPRRSDRVFDYDTYSFGGRWRGNAAFGFWQLAYASRAELNADNFDAATNAMLLTKGDGNRRLNIKPDLLICGVTNRVKAAKLLLAKTETGGADNIRYKQVELLDTAWLSD
uniref:Mu-like prophage major head subunit gpT n=1 Tax=Candidatus Kentrum sp. LPFa TaxID=2126335 RepID=A0A450WTK2_9GAMM|nr:MAG: Mu-like prophage major head subunit gpT [Candidatus Kentron sp. LPFa]